MFDALRKLVRDDPGLGALQIAQVVPPVLKKYLVKRHGQPDLMIEAHGYWQTYGCLEFYRTQEINAVTTMTEGRRTLAAGTWSEVEEIDV